MIRDRLDPCRWVWLAACLVVVGMTGRLPAHPTLAPETNFDQWHAPDASGEAVYIGAEDDPTLVLKRDPIAAGDLTVQIVTDAAELRLRAGEDEIIVKLTPNVANALRLNGTELHPTLELDGQELAPLRGMWIRMFLKSGDTPVRLVLPKAGYANLSFRSSVSPPTSRPRVRLSGLGRVTIESGDAPNAAPIAVSTRSVTPIRASAATPVRAATPGSPSPSEPGRQTAPVDRGQQRMTAPSPQASPDTAAPKRALYGTPDDLDPHLYPPHPFKLLFDVGVQATNAYFYRGIAQENQNLIVQTWLDTRLRLFEGQAKSFIDYVDLNAGFFTSSHWGTTGTGGPPGMSSDKWYEFDWYGGVRVGVFDRFEFAMLNDNRASINNNFGGLNGDVHQINFILSFDDHDPRYAWQLWPYAMLSWEYEFQSDAGGVVPSRTDTGIYLELGLRPQFELLRIRGNRPVTLAVPVRVGLSVADYYEDATGADETFGYLDVGAELEVPIFSMHFAKPTGRLDASLFGGVHVLYLGETAERISVLYGGGGDDVEVIGVMGMRARF